MSRSSTTFQAGHPKLGGRGSGTENRDTVLRKTRIEDAALEASQWLGDTTGMSNRDFLIRIRDCPHLPASQRQKAAEKLVDFEESKPATHHIVDDNQRVTVTIRDLRTDPITIDHDPVAVLPSPIMVIANEGD